MELTISSRQNLLVRRFKALITEKKERDLEGVFVIEGLKIMEEAVQENAKILQVLVTPDFASKNSMLMNSIARTVPISFITADIASYVSDTKTPQGIIAIAERPKHTINWGMIKTVMILDGIADMGNVGTIVRTTDALGGDLLVLSNGSADVFSPKVVRATMGAVLRLPIITTDLTDFIPTLIEHGFGVYATLLNKEALKLGTFTFKERSAIIIGNEASGISDPVKALATDFVYIPISRSESLNASIAAGVVLWELKSC